MNQLHLIILAAIVLFVGVLYFTGFLEHSKEGFAQSAICPIGYQFFTNSAGASLCCKGGTINPYTNTCEKPTDPTAQFAMCAFSENTPNPYYNPGATSSTLSNPAVLRLCSAIDTEQMQSGADSFCPTKYSHLAQEKTTTVNGTTTMTEGKCCQYEAIKKNDGLYTCSSRDLTEKTYCIAKGPVDESKGERSCLDIKSEGLLENISCPSNGSIPRQKVLYAFGSRETAASAYGSAVANVKIPICVAPDASTCIPKESIKYAQVYGAFTALDTDAKIANWTHSCTATSGASNNTYIVKE
jgi:hypothetical protein